MKFKSKLALTLILPFAFTTSSVFADKADCYKWGIGPSTLLHCVYTSGLTPSDPKNGRFIKYQFSSGNLVLCSGNNTAVPVNNSIGNLPVGENLISVSICPDASGTKCLLLGKDQFVVSQNNSGTLQANPQYYELNLSGVATDKSFPTCDSTGFKKPGILNK